MLRLKVLIIDDSPMIREMLRDAFQAEGFRVMEAPNGEDALKQAWKDHPDLIVADIKMPGIDGWEVCRQIRKHPYTSFIPFIFLTEKREVSDRIKGLEMGADDYITKPFDAEELVARARAIFNRMLKREEERIIQSRGLRGSTEIMELSDLLQLFGINSKTGILKVTQPQSGVGRIGFVNGRLTNAELGKFKGVKAIRRMLRWKDANFQVEPLLDETHDVEIPRKIEEVLMSARQEQDELARHQKALPRSGLIERTGQPVNMKELTRPEARVLDALSERGRSKMEQLLDWLPDGDMEIYQATVSLVKKNLIAKK